MRLSIGLILWKARFALAIVALTCWEKVGFLEKSTPRYFIESLNGTGWPLIEIVTNLRVWRICFGCSLLLPMRTMAAVFAGLGLIFHLLKYTHSSAK